MIRFYIRLAIISIFATMFGIACSNTTNTDNSAADRMRSDANSTLQKANDTLNDASDVLQQQMDQFRRDMNANIASIDAKIEELEVKRESIADAEAKDAYNARLVQIRNDRDALQLRIDEMDNHRQDETDWQHFEDETRSAWHDLENGVKGVIDDLFG